MIKRCLIGFFLIMTLAFLPLKINAATSYTTMQEYDFENFSLTYNNITYDKEIIYSKIEKYLTENTEYKMSDYSYIFIGVPAQPTTSTGSTLGFIYVDLFSEDFINNTSFTASNTAWGYWKVNYSSSNYIHLQILFSSGEIRLSSANSGYYVTSMMSGNSTSKNMNVYTNFNIDSSMIVNNSNYLDYMKIYVDNTMMGEKTYNVTFHLNGGVADYSTMTLPANTNLNDYLNYAKESGWYKEPTKIGFQFGGWTYDICTGFDENDNCIYETLYLENNPNTILDQDMTLKASWSPTTSYLEEDMETLTFDTNYKYLAISYPDNNKDRYLTIKGSIVPGTAYYYANDKWNYVDGYSYRPLDFEYNAFKIHDSNYNKQYYLLSKELLGMNNSDYTFSIHKGANLYYLNDPNSENIGFVDSSGTNNDFTFGDDTVIFDDSFTYVGEDKDEIVDLGLLQPLLDLVYDKLPIINQFLDILNQFNFNEEVDEPPVFKVNIPYFNLNDVEVFNFQFFLEYRDYIINLQCFVLGIYTAIKAFKIVKGYFGGDTGE